MKHHDNAGFTAIEILVTLVVGLLFVMIFYQLYSVVMGDSAATHNRSKANNIAYAKLREISNSGYVSPNNCVVPSPQPPATTLTQDGLPAPATMTVVVDCPYSLTPPNVSRITVTITYGSPQETVKHVVFK